MILDSCETSTAPGSRRVQIKIIEIESKGWFAVASTGQERNATLPPGGIVCAFNSGNTAVDAFTVDENGFLCRNFWQPVMRGLV